MCKHSFAQPGPGMMVSWHDMLMSCSTAAMSCHGATHHTMPHRVQNVHLVAPLCQESDSALSWRCQHRHAEFTRK